MFLMITTFFNIGSVFADPNEPGDFEKPTRTIMTVLLGLMKFWRMAGGTCTGYVERVRAVRF
jgi:hypothetical protein